MMKARTNNKESRLRQQLAAEAARIMAIEGVSDFHLAKRKAAARLGMSNLRHLPANSEIETALAEYQRLFRANAQPKHLRWLRETAANIMQMLESFRPALVGPVLSGTADSHSKVLVHVFADTAEALSLFLLERNIPFELAERRFTLASGRQTGYPTFRFVAGDAVTEVTVFPPKGKSDPPQSPVDGQPMRRASLQQLRALLLEE